MESNPLAMTDIILLAAAGFAGEILGMGVMSSRPATAPVPVVLPAAPPQLRRLERH